MLEVVALPTRRKAEYPPPDGLSERAQELWRQVVPKHAVSAGRLALIEQALHALDRADEAAALVDAEGLTKTTEATGAVHVHPAQKVERESRQLFSKLWISMGLGWSSQEDGRLRDY